MMAKLKSTSLASVAALILPLIAFLLALVLAPEMPPKPTDETTETQNVSPKAQVPPEAQTQGAQKE